MIQQTHRSEIDPLPALLPTTKDTNSTMSLEIRDVDNDDVWNELIEQSPQQTPFHWAEALGVRGVLEHYIPPDRGLQRVRTNRLSPVLFALARPVRVVFSPPSELNIAYLGPILLNQDQVKQ
jgi:hypothetical protein